MIQLRPLVLYGRLFRAISALAVEVDEDCQARVDKSCASSALVFWCGFFLPCVDLPMVTHHIPKVSGPGAVLGEAPKRKRPQALGDTEAAFVGADVPGAAGTIPENDQP